MTTLRSPSLTSARIRRTTTSLSECELTRGGAYGFFGFSSVMLGDLRKIDVVVLLGEPLSTMRTQLQVVAVVLFFASCSAMRPGTPVNFRVMGAETLKACLVPLVSRSRTLGYVEDVADHEAGFFRVRARTDSTGKTIEKAGRRYRKDVVFGVQCTTGGAVSVFAAHTNGTQNLTETMHKPIRAELDAFAGALRQ